MDDGALLDGLAGIGRRYAGAGPVPVRVGRPDTGAVLLRVGPVVVKAHAAGTDPVALAARLTAAAGPALAGVLLAPLATRPVPVGDRWVSVWPYGATVPVDPARVPWTAAAALLARLHTAAPDAGAGELAGLPPTGASARIAGPVALLADGPVDGVHGWDPAGAVPAGLRGDPVGVLRAAWQALPPWARGGAPASGPVAVIHGDWHLGQLIAPAPGGWRLADVDDLGAGSPIWDFARLAALRALGVVREDEFRGFLDAYWAAGGLALRPDDPGGWAALDAAAQAQVVSAAARRLAHPDPGRRDPDGLTGDLLLACARLAGVA